MIWFAALIVLGTLQLLTMGARAAAPSDSPGLANRFGPLWPLIVAALLTLWIMTTATVFRAVLRPAEHGWHLLRLGADEGRLAMITAAGFVLVALFGSGPAIALLALARPVLALAPGLARWWVLGGAIATVAVEVWIAVRLSLTAVQTFAEGRFRFVGYWRLTEGCFWRLLASYVAVSVQVAIFLIIVGVIALALGKSVVALTSAGAAGWLGRAAALGLAFGVALVSAVIFVAPLTLLAACQAKAYAIIADGRDHSG
ncbi:MAG TPA: hypothetical protein VGS12_04460 [Caulobacteraceae bacterium]|nr:hypothetical protein [Caulobacteraceae bacterium]